MPESRKPKRKPVPRVSSGKNPLPWEMEADRAQAMRGPEKRRQMSGIKRKVPDIGKLLPKKAQLGKAGPSTLDAKRVDDRRPTSARKAVPVPKKRAPERTNRVKGRPKYD